ncbi:superoxide dismutase, Cu-Zn family [Sphingomonas laterariae]|uniref:Superoxide dismutase [Cu-Zn] n=1 Tax=Edaphosphingomonas laterariae TaxID=861865 RepID=A0A239DKJ9_9SPHN|nr:superoxide dismutase family protein [Sphingomonas laterariae]SNS32966.1 superoxide dismutase, Cu-Zn family [Sphingomonas laterariae]
MRHLMIAPLAAAGLLAACASSGSADTAPEVPATTSATANLVGPDGTAMGIATLTQMSDGIRLVVDGRGLPAGPHGLHVHQTGKCEAPGFTTAGGHWNPTNMVHGKDAAGGPHWGDLPNLIAGTDGAGRLEVTLPGTRLAGGDHPLFDADGAAVVIHAGPDDYKTDPSGNSGGRIACGVVMPN